MSIRWSDEASADLEALHAYIARDSPTYARRFIERLLTAVDRLEEFPESGRHVPEAAGEPTVRELLFQSYRIVYVREAEGVRIITVIHGSRDLAGIDPRPWER